MKKTLASIRKDLNRIYEKPYLHISRHLRDLDDVRHYDEGLWDDERFSIMIDTRVWRYVNGLTSKVEERFTEALTDIFSKMEEIAEIETKFVGVLADEVFRQLDI